MDPHPGHTDVVPPGERKAWGVDPFEAIIKNGVLIGRGAVDMKPAIAAWVAAVSRFLESSERPRETFRGRISLLITGDEEGEARYGTRKVLEWLKARGEKLNACIVGEPTNPKKLGEMIKIGRRGSVSFVLTVHGTQGHVAYPDLADNPVTRIIQILSRLKAHQLDKGTEFFPPSNLEITSMNVQNPASNVIPADAEARFNIRFNDQHTGGSLLEWVHAQCKTVAKDYTLEHHLSGEAFLTPPGYLSQLVSRSVESITGYKPELSTTGGTSDARFIKDVCPVVEFGLINETAHKVNEHIGVDAIQSLADIYERILRGYFLSVSHNTL